LLAFDIFKRQIFELEKKKKVPENVRLNLFAGIKEKKRGVMVALIF
jgi:hypothetical protein